MFLIPRMMSDFLKKRSIVFQLTALYSVSAILILAISCLFLYWILANNFKNSTQKAMIDEATIVQTILNRANNEGGALAQEIIWEPQGAHYPYYARLLSSQGKILIEPSGMDKKFAEVDFPKPQTLADSSALDFVNYQRKHNHYKLVSIKTTPTTNNAKSYIIQIAWKFTKEHDVLKRYKFYLMIVLILGLLIATTIGYLIAKRSLQPLKALSDEMSAITVNHLETKIEKKSWPAELTAIANEFSSMLKRVDQGYKRVTQFSSDLAHELRTPINSIIVATEVGLSAKRDVKEYLHLLTDNLEDLKKLATLIDKLLFLAHADDAKQALKLTRFNVATEINTMIEFYQAMSDEKNIAITLSGTAEIGADLILFRRVISNLISNAIKYTADNGRIIITITKINSNNDCKITIEDNGCGIAKGHLPNIFDRFYRVDDSRATTSGGNGLGLAIVQSIIKAHQGSIHIDSVVDQGTTVTLLLPVAQKK